MRVITRKIGNENYYYLQFVYRTKNKVAVKEKYLGKQIPKNIKQIEEDFIKEIRKPIYEKLEKIKQNFRKEWHKYPISAREKELHEIAIAFTYNTNAIEGSTITQHEVREITQDNIAPNKSLRDIRETESHYKVFLEMLKNKEKISNKLLLEWHNQIFGETKKDISGKFRNYDVRVGSYVAVDWQDVNKMIAELIQLINSSKLNPVELSARAHYRFEKTHPFGDGNGRIGRLIMNHILWHKEYPMLIIEYKKRMSYYKALEKDEEGFVNYYLKRYLRVHNKRIK